MSPEGPPADASGRAASISTVLSILSACAAAALAVWLFPASVHIVEWPRSGPQRIAVFAPLYRLFLFLAVAVVAACGVFVFGRRRLAWLAHLVAPVSILWVWTVPYWPWLPDRLPLLVALAGPIRWVFAALAVGGVVVNGGRGLLRVQPSFAASARWETAGRRTVFVVSLLVYLGFGLRTLQVNGLGGDEPHYLIIAQSLMLDGDLKIENNHARRDYRSYFPGELRPDYMTRGIDREIYSIHAPGLSALLIPGFAVAGARGAVATMCLFAALAALAVFEMALLVVSSVPVAFATWAAVCLTVPFIPHAWSLFPEMAGTAIVAWGLLWGMQAIDRSVGVWMARGICLAWLPWLHTKFSVLMAGVALYLLWQLRTTWARAAALLAPMAISGCAWLAMFYAIYGSFSPEAPYGEYAARFVRFENVPRSVFGLLFDQKFGLLVYAPAFALALPGYWLALRDGRWRALGLASLGITAVFGISSARLYMWWGGSSAPARFLVPLAPLLAAPLALGVQHLRSLVWRVTWSACALFSVGVALAGAVGAQQYLLYSEPHGVSRMLDLLQGSAPVTAMLPTFTQPEWIRPAVQVVPWAGAVAVALAGGWWVARRGGSPLWILTGELCLFVVSASALASAVPAEARAEARMRGDVALLERFDPVRRRAFDYGRWQRLSPEAWLQALTLSIDRQPGSEPDPVGRLTGPLRLPAGVYDARVWFEGGRQLPGALQANVGYDNLLARVEGPLDNPAVMTVTLPIAVPALWLQLTDLTSAKAVRQLDVVPRSVVPAGDRASVEIDAVEAVPDRANAYVAHLSGTYPEHGVFWTRGVDAGRLLLAPAGASTVGFVVHVGPHDGPVTVRLQVGDRIEPLTLEGNGTATVKVPLPAGAAVVPINVQASAAFRPADVDPSSTDLRQLGCQVRLVLE